MLEPYIVGIHSRIAGGCDSTVVWAEDETEALELGKPNLNMHMLTPDFLNDYSRIYVQKVDRNAKWLNLQINIGRN